MIHIPKLVKLPNIQEKLNGGGTQVLNMVLILLTTMLLQKYLLFKKNT